MSDIDPVEFGEMRSDIKNINSTTQRIEQVVLSGFEKQDKKNEEQGKKNEELDGRITWNKNKLIWLVALLVGSGVLGTGVFKYFG